MVREVVFPNREVLLLNGHGVPINCGSKHKQLRRTVYVHKMVVISFISGFSFLVVSGDSWSKYFQC